MLWPRLDPGRVLRHEQSALRNRARELRVRARVNGIESAAEHGDRSADLLERAAVARAVDADRKAARDREAVLGQMTCELLRGVAPAARRVAAADHCELRAREQRKVGALDPQRER